MHCIDCFGVDRSMFGSDFPVGRLWTTFDAIFDGFKAIVRDFSEAEQLALFYANARRVLSHRSVLTDVSTGFARLSTRSEQAEPAGLPLSSIARGGQSSLSRGFRKGGSVLGLDIGTSVTKVAVFDSETLSISKGPKIPHLDEFARKSAIVAQLSWAPSLNFPVRAWPQLC